MPAAQPKEMPMTDPTPETLSVRIGLMIPDSLRLAGMQEILRDGSTYLVCAVASLVPAEIDALDLLVIDEVMTDHLFPLLTALQRARPRLHLLIIGADAGAAHAEQIIGAGARGYLTYRATASDLRSAVEVILDGSMWAPRRVLAQLLEQARRETGSGSRASVRFSKRENEVLRLLIDGRSNREIAEALGIDEGTVKSHLSRMMTKAGVRNRTALGMAAVREGWASR
jgi:DNA-binding NarL/FixJ family response regulator